MIEPSLSPTVDAQLAHLEILRRDLERAALEIQGIKLELERLVAAHSFKTSELVFLSTVTNTKNAS